jgi:hypothetical protein
MPLLPDVAVMFMSSIALLTPNEQLLECAATAFSERYVYSVPTCARPSGTRESGSVHCVRSHEIDYAYSSHVRVSYQINSKLYYPRWHLTQTVTHLHYTRVFQVQILAVTEVFFFFPLLRTLQAKVTKLHRQSDNC